MENKDNITDKVRLDNVEIGIVTYRFDTSKSEEQKQYADLKIQLRERGLELFDFIAMCSSSIDQEKKIRTGIYHVETKHLFSNQYNTEEGFRVFDWSEKIFPNSSIKDGYYITNSENFKGLKELIHKTFACGYCGKQSLEFGDGFCHRCAGSEFLEISNYPLLELRPVDFKGSRDKEIPESLINEINKSQKEARTKRLKKDVETKRKRLKKDIENSAKELEAFEWLISNDMDYKNVIYYNHTDTFSFGWSKPIEDKEALERSLEGFPFKYEIK